MKEQKRYDQYMYSYPHKRAYYPLSQAVIQEAVLQIPGDQELTLYIHVPFCSSKCGYCNLFSVVSVDEGMREDYVTAVLRQIEQYGKATAGKQINIKQVILGGGTPFMLSVGQIERLFTALEQQFQFSLSDCGFDMETSPKETTEEMLSYLLQRGMHRLSMGVQSFHPHELAALKRHHSVDSCQKALDGIMKFRPPCVNLDFIYGIEGQSVHSFLESLKRALQYQPDELFLYPLYVRQETALFDGTVADQEIQYQLYQIALEFLLNEGYTQTSMRRFARKAPIYDNSCGFEQMLAFGCGGRSYLGHVHFCEPYQVAGKACRSILDNYQKKVDFFEGVNGYILNKDEQMRRFVIKNLGYYNGVSKQEFSQLFRLNLMDVYRSAWSELECKGDVRQNHDRMILTQKGMGDSDRILALWISEKVAKGMSRC